VKAKRGSEVASEKWIEIRLYSDVGMICGFGSWLVSLAFFHASCLSN